MKVFNTDGRLLHTSPSMVSDVAYDEATWNGVTNVAPSKNAVRDKLEAGVAAHKDSHDPEDGSDALDAATASEIAGVQAAAEGSAHSLARSDHAHQIQHSIADNHLLTVDGSIHVSEYAKFTASGLEGRNFIEVAGDIQNNIKKIIDGTSKFEVESTNGPLVGTVAGTEAFLLSDIGILTLAKQSMATAYHEYDGAVVLWVENGKWVIIPCNTETFDQQGELDTTQKTGSATATTANHLIDTTLNQFTSADVGAQIFNTTDKTCAKVTAYNSTSDLTLDADIMANGESYALQRTRFTATEAGKYIVAAGFEFTSCEDQKRVALFTFLNGSSTGGKRIFHGHTSGTQTFGGTGLVFHDLAANDYVEVNIYYTGTIPLQFQHIYSWVGFLKVG